MDERQLKEMQLMLARLKTQLETEKKQNAMKTFEEKRDEKAAKAQESWPMIRVIERYLLLFAIVDFTCQIGAQLPLCEQTELMTDVGFRKVWKEPATGFFYSNYIATGNHAGLVSLRVDWTNFVL